MRLHLLLLLLISGLSQNVGYAGTLVGDWYQEEIKDTPNTERRAFSQPTSQSTEANQVTLGIKSPGLIRNAKWGMSVIGGSDYPQGHIYTGTCPASQ